MLAARISRAAFRSKKLATPKINAPRAFPSRARPPNTPRTLNAVINAAHHPRTLARVDQYRPDICGLGLDIGPSFYGEGMIEA